jgi:cation diffusion facilitator CzcD-associated flavoprotein CzcO
MTSDHYDVLIIGAGLSGIGMACRLATACPGKRVGILERRRAIGGTWDLFRYPGVRSDSDMFTFGFGFRPWNELKVLADGPAIRDYVIETAREYGIDKAIRFGLRTTHAAWSSDDARWMVTALDDNGTTHAFTACFLVGCTGYYAYEQGYVPDFPGLASYLGASSIRSTGRRTSTGKASASSSSVAVRRRSRSCRRWRRRPRR